ncbi:unnamed protein product [Linum tenue]|uniref:Retrotransposon gag domain-containing protein n=1 Tax=Linum tenue TaxID=586396 RepID=A0AAV0PNN0_9ROSI|nr:unnamed protein product [Linum tenue]
MMEENRKLVAENRQPMTNQPTPHRMNRGEIPATTQVEGIPNVGVGEIPPRGENLGVTHSAPVEPPPIPIPMARPYTVPAHMGGGVGLGGGDQVPPRAYPTPMPPHFNGHGMDPMGFVPQGGQPGGHDPNTLRDQVAQLLAEQFGMGVRPTMPPVYRKPYPEWVDRLYPFPRGFRVPEFATFTGTGDQSTVEHIGRFTVQCGDVGDFIKLRVFGNSLTGPAFAWYVNLPSNSIQTWQQMEQIFHAQFYRSEREVSMADLARMRQEPGESVEHFLTNFKNARNRCFVNLTEREFVKLAQGGLSFELRKKFQDREFSDLFQLMSCAVRYESLLQEEENRRSASRGQYFPNIGYPVNHIGQEANEVEVDLAELTPGKPYVCAPLAKMDNEPQGGRPNRAPIQPRRYSFDISKADLIFDQLYKDGQIKLTGGHNIPPPEKLKGKKYCKWHNSMSHATDSCVIFRNILQDAIEKGRIKFPEPKKDAMLVDTDPFPNVVGINMVNPDLSKIELPRFKLVLDTTPPQHGSSNVTHEQGSSSGTKQASPAAMMTDEIEKLCAQCKKSLKLDEARPSAHQRLGPPNRPRYPSYQRQVEGVVQPAWGQRRQWIAHGIPSMRSPPVRSPPARTFKMPNVPQGGWHTYDMRRQQPVAIGGMTRTQRRRFLRKNAEARQGRYPVILGATIRPPPQNDFVPPNIEVDNSMTTGLKVTMTDKGKQVQVQGDVKIHEGVEDDFQEEGGEYEDEYAEDDMLDDEHPNPKFDRGNKDDEGDDQGPPLTIQFGSLPPVVVTNYILPMVFQFNEEDRDRYVEEEEVIEEAEDTDGSVAELTEAFARLEASDEPWGVRMARLGSRIDLAAEVARQGKSSQRILKELHEAGHKSVGLLGEDDGRYPFYVLYQGPEASSSAPIHNPAWGWEFDGEAEGSAAKEESSTNEEEVLQLATLKGKGVMKEENTSDELSHLVVFKEPEPSMLRHLRPLYIKARLDGMPMSRILVDNGAAVNVIPTRLLRKLGKTTSDLIPTDIFVTSFNGGSTSARGILPVLIGVGSQEKMSAFFVVDGAISYNALLGRDWIHANKCVPSSLHQCLMFWNKEGMVEVVQADTNPFAVGANVAEAPLYHGDFGPLQVRSMDGGSCTVVMSSAKILSMACLDPLADIVRPSMIALDGPPKAEASVNDE